MAENAIRTDNNVPSIIVDNWNWETVRVKWDTKGWLIMSWKWWNGVESDITSDAWWKFKVTHDLSIFHALWTYDIPTSIWLLFEDWSEVLPPSASYISSINGEMVMNVGSTLDQRACLQSRRHPRYQPNRWHLFSTTCFLPDPSVTGAFRRWGLYNRQSNCDVDNWAYFELDDGILYACITSNTVTTRQEISSEVLTGKLWSSFDLSKGNLYDIQFQWRWVWDYFYFINQKLVHTINNLGTLDNVSILNPALPVSYHARNTWYAWDVIIKSGCTDVTSEWGELEWLTYISTPNILTGASQWRAISNRDNPLMIVRVKETFNSLQNTRDVHLFRINVSSDQKSIGKIYVTRDSTAFSWTSFPSAFTDARMDSVIEKIDCVDLNNTEISSIDTTKSQLVYSWRVPQDWSLVVWNPSENVEFILRSWDYLVLTWERENGWNCNMFGTLEFWEEI